MRGMEFVRKIKGGGVLIQNRGELHGLPCLRTWNLPCLMFLLSLSMHFKYWGSPPIPQISQSSDSVPSVLGTFHSVAMQHLHSFSLYVIY